MEEFRLDTFPEETYTEKEFNRTKKGEQDMRKLLLAGTVLLGVASLGCLLFSGLAWRGYRSLLDGTPEKYQRLLFNAKLFFWLGLGAGLLAGACFLIGKKCWQGE